MDFIFHERIGNGADAIPDDADPTSTAPPDNRIVKLGEIPPHAANGITVWAIDGTTITAQPFVFEPFLRKWLPLKSSGSTVTPAGPTVFTTAGLGLAKNAEVFLRLTTNTGVTRVVWRYG